MTAMKVVPLEPTDEMKIAAIKLHRGWLGDYFSFDYWAGVYKSMLSAVEPAPDGLVERLLDYADNPAANGYVPISPKTLREAAAALTSRAAVDGQPVAWVRFCSDGTHEGPLMDCAIEDVRKKSGAWTPLYKPASRAAVLEEAAKNDTERLDYLDALNAEKNSRIGTTYGWRLSENHNRIALEDHNYPPLNVRAAIDAAIRTAKGE